MIAVDPSAAERGHAGAVCACGGAPARPVRIRLPQWRAPETRDLCARHEAEARAEGLVVEGGGLVRITTHPPSEIEATMKPKCIVPSCSITKLQGRGLCGRHYGALRSAGRLPVDGGPPAGADLAAMAEAEADVAANGSSLTAAFAACLGRDEAPVAPVARDGEEVAALRQEIARLTAAKAELEAALTKETEAAQRMTKYANDTERMRVSVRDDGLRLRKELEGWRSPKTAADDEIDAALDDAEIPSDGPRHERVRALADQAMADQRVVESLREILTAALGPDAEGKSPLALVELAAVRLGSVAPVAPATEELGRLDSLAHQRAAHAKGLQETLADVQAADQQVREILAPVLGLDVTGAPAATMAEQAAAALKGTHDALDQLGVPYLTGRAGETPAKRILAHALTVGDVLDEEGCPDPHGPLVDRIRAWGESNKPPTYTVGQTLPGGHEVIWAGGVEEARLYCRLAEEAHAALDEAGAPSMVLPTGDATPAARLRAWAAELKQAAPDATAAALASLLGSVEEALEDARFPELAGDNTPAARIRAHMTTVHGVLDAAGCPDEDGSGDPGLVGRIGAWAQELGEALDEAGAPPTPSIVARLAAWAAHARPLMEAAEEADDALRAVGAPDDDALAVYRMGLRIRAWAEDHASDVDRARAQGRAEARDRLITRLHDSEPLRLGAAAVVAPGSRALREAARSSDAAGPLALDLLDVREEGAPPPRQPVHPALVDLDGAPVCLELMGHRRYEGVLTALGGASYRIAPLDGEAVHGVWGSAIYAARVIDPEVWARTVAAHEDAVRREREAATVPRWRHLHWASHPDGSVFVEEEDQEIGNCRLAAADEALLAFDERPKARQGRLARCTLSEERGRAVVTVQEWGDWFTMDDDELAF